MIEPQIETMPIKPEVRDIMNHIAGLLAARFNFTADQNGKFPGMEDLKILLLTDINHTLEHGGKPRPYYHRALMRFNNHPNIDVASSSADENKESAIALGIHSSLLEVFLNKTPFTTYIDEIENLSQNYDIVVAIDDSNLTLKIMEHKLKNKVLPVQINDVPIFRGP